MTRDEKIERARTLKRLFVDGGDTGPWAWRHIDGFGPARFLVTDDPKLQWSRVVATICNATFDTGEAIARSRTDVPAIVDLLDELLGELASAKERYDALHERWSAACRSVDTPSFKRLAELSVLSSVAPRVPLEVLNGCTHDVSNLAARCAELSRRNDAIAAWLKENESEYVLKQVLGIVYGDDDEAK